MHHQLRGYNLTRTYIWGYANEKRLNITSLVNYGCCAWGKLGEQNEIGVRKVGPRRCLMNRKE